jgi:hypothetical protein
VGEFACECLKEAYTTHLNTKVTRNWEARLAQATPSDIHERAVSLVTLLIYHCNNDNIFDTHKRHFTGTTFGD